MEAVVNEFPAPPAHSKEFQDSEYVLPPPAIPSHVETYGGVIPSPESETLEEKKSAHQLPQQIKEILAEFMQHALQFAADVNRREPVEIGVANLEILISKVYEKISKYRYHEARENICDQLRKELQDLTASRDEMERLYSEAKAVLDE